MSDNYRMLVKMVRISYPHLFQPKAAAPNAQPKYSCALVVPKDHPTVAELNTAYAQVAGAAWPQGAPAGMAFPWSDGDTDPKLNDPAKAPNIFLGAVRFQCNSTTRPTVVDEHKVEVIDPGKIYAGCYVHASISLYSYVNKPGNGVTFGLDGIMFAAEGDRLDGRPSNDSMFADIPGAPPATAGGIPGGEGAPVQPGAPAGGVLPQ